MSDQIRILRVLEYSGDRAAVEKHIQDVLQGHKTFDCYENNDRKVHLGTVVIKAATVGVIADILDESVTVTSMPDAAAAWRRLWATLPSKPELTSQLLNLASACGVGLNAQQELMRTLQSQEQP